jgi:hypothetical protein
MDGKGLVQKPFGFRAKAAKKTEGKSPLPSPPARFSREIYHGQMVGVPLTGVGGDYSLGLPGLKTAILPGSAQNILPMPVSLQRPGPAKAIHCQNHWLV